MIDIITEKTKEAESILYRGIDLLKDHRLTDAHRIFESAYEMDPENQRICSYYGYTCAMEHDLVQKGLKLCSQAADSGIPDPMIWLNLAKIYIKIGNRRNAIAAMQRGLKIERGHKEIVKYWKKIGMRRKPVIKLLHRDNLLNRFLGRWTYQGRLVQPKKKKKQKKKK